MEELNPTQKMMIKAIEEEIYKTRALIEKSKDDREAKKLRLRLANLKKQWDNAHTTVHRTPEEIKKIEEIVKNVKDNAEVVSAEIEGDRSDKKLTPKEEFEYRLKTYVTDMKNRVVEAKKAAALYKEVSAVLKGREPFCEENMYKGFVDNISKQCGAIDKSLATMEGRIASSDEMIKLCMENFEMLEKINSFLNNPLNLPGFES